MNAGLSNLATLKAWLLPAGMQAATDYDVKLGLLGTGILGQFEKHCNRRFLRVENEIEMLPADRTKHVVARYPIETVAKVEVQQTMVDGWAELSNSGLVVNRLDSAGIIYFYGQQGWQRGMMRITYTGGYWFEPLEPDDEGYPTDQPAGAALVPDDLRLAWLLQCEHIWRIGDKLGLAIGEKPEQQRAIRSGAGGVVELADEVRDKLSGFIRYQLA
jgi:hypothetical protein